MKRMSFADDDGDVAVWRSFAAAVVEFVSKTFYIDVNHRKIFYHDLAIFHVHSFSTDTVADDDSSDLELMAVAVVHATYFYFSAAKRVDSLSLELQDGFRDFAEWFQSNSSVLSPEVFATIDN